jgi:hypothetical protein
MGGMAYKGRVKCLCKARVLKVLAMATAKAEGMVSKWKDEEMMSIMTLHRRS